MKKQIARWMLITFIALAATVGIIYAYIALTSTGEVTVEENLSWVGDNTFSVTLYPQESETVSLTIANASSVAIDVDLASVVTPDPGAKGLTVSVPNKLTAPANGQISFDVVIAAGKSAEPQAYTIEITVER